MPVTDSHPAAALRILAISPVYWPSVGGGERLLGSILEHLVARGHEATVLTVDAASHPDMFRSKGAGLPPREIHAGVQIRRFSPGGGLPGRALSWLNVRPGVYDVLQAASGGLSELITARPNPLAFLGAMAWARADVIVAANWWSAVPLMGTVVARYRRIPVVALPLLHIVRPWANRPVLRRALPLCSCTVGLTPSETVHQRLLGARRTTVIGGAIAADWGQAADGAALRRRLGLGDRPVVGFVGRQDELKGAPTLVAAMRLVWRQRPDAVLLLAGQAAHRDGAMRAALEGLPSDDRRQVAEVPDFTDAEAPDVFAACDLLAQPSIEESFGLVLIEAWMMGRPVIGARIPATCDLVSEGEDGLIVPPTDPPALAAAILQLVAAPEARARMGERGRAKVLARYTTGAMVDAWESLLVETAGAGRGKRRP
jgi:glycosyltransferase involved in cell wall biosynthesis